MSIRHSIVGIVLSLASSAALAGLIGDDVVIQWYYPDLATPVYPSFGPFTVEAGDGDEQLEPFQDISLNVEDESLHIFFDPANGPIQWLDAVFNGPVFDDLDWVGDPGIVIAGIFVSATVEGFTDDRVTFTDHSVLVDFEGLIHTGGQVDIDLVFAEVPEPGALGLLGAGLIAFALTAVTSRRRAGSR